MFLISVQASSFQTLMEHIVHTPSPHILSPSQGVELSIT